MQYLAKLRAMVKGWWPWRRVEEIPVAVEVQPVPIVLVRRPITAGGWRIRPHLVPGREGAHFHVVGPDGARYHVRLATADVAGLTDDALAKKVLAKITEK